MTIPLNIDLGEDTGPAGLAHDLLLLGLSDRVNVACGFHAGDAETMAAICDAARESGRSVGAHVSYRDREWFGRRETGDRPDTIARDTAEQLELITEIASGAGVALVHVKPHGALYHRLCSDLEAAAAFTAVVRSFRSDLELLTAPVSALADAARLHRLPVLREGFADRAYMSSGGLVPRDHPGSVLTPDEAAGQALALAGGEPVPTSDGEPIRLDVETVCVHGDGPQALETARAVRQALDRS